MTPASAFSARPPSGGVLAEARIAPGARPGWRVSWVDGRVGVGLLVADQGPVRGVAAVDAVLVARLPKGLVAAEESEVHAGCTCSLDVGTLISRPILVGTDRHVHLMLLESGRAAAIGVDTAGVRHVVAVGFHPADHRVLGIEEPALAMR